MARILRFLDENGNELISYLNGLGECYIQIGDINTVNDYDNTSYIVLEKEDLKAFIAILENISESM